MSTYVMSTVCRLQTVTIASANILHYFYWERCLPDGVGSFFLASYGWKTDLPNQTLCCNQYYFYQSKNTEWSWMPWDRPLPTTRSCQTRDITDDSVHFKVDLLICEIHIIERISPNMKHWITSPRTKSIQNVPIWLCYWALSPLSTTLTLFLSFTHPWKNRLAWRLLETLSQLEVSNFIKPKMLYVTKQWWSGSISLWTAFRIEHRRLWLSAFGTLCMPLC